MCWVLNKYLVLLALLTFGCYVLPLETNAGTAFPAGKQTADAAASMRSDDTTESPQVIPLRYALTMGHTYARADTTEFEFPDEEKSHLVRDVTIFLIASAFVGYFIIKVFLEGDTEETEDDPGGGGKPDPI